METTCYKHGVGLGQGPREPDRADGSERSLIRGGVTHRVNGANGRKPGAEPRLLPVHAGPWVRNWTSGF